MRDWHDVFDMHLCPSYSLAGEAIFAPMVCACGNTVTKTGRNAGHVAMLLTGQQSTATAQTQNGKGMGFAQGSLAIFPPQ